MHTLRRQVSIAAPVERVWHAVHVDIASVPRWSHGLVSTKIVGGGPLAVGSELVYVVRLPMSRSARLHLHVEEYEEYTRCSGSVEGSVLSGTWMWRYRERDGLTVVVYETAVNLKGMLRFAGPLAEQQVLGDVRRNLDALKEYVEGGGRQR